MKKLTLVLLLFFSCNKQPTIDSIQESNIRLEEQINVLKTKIYEDSLQLVELHDNYTQLEFQYANEKKKYRPTETIISEKLTPIITLSDSAAYSLFTNNLKSTD